MGVFMTGDLPAAFMDHFVRFSWKKDNKNRAECVVSGEKGAEEPCNDPDGVFLTCKNPHDGLFTEKPG